MSKIKNSGLDQFGAEPFKQPQFGTFGTEGLKLAAVAACALYCTYTAPYFMTFTWCVFMAQCANTLSEPQYLLGLTG